MQYVYLIQSQSHPSQRYIGLTSDLKSRLAKHDEGGSPHTAKFRPWRLKSCIAFETHDQAAIFERYIKSGSGRAFANGILGHFRTRVLLAGV